MSPDKQLLATYERLGLSRALLYWTRVGTDPKEWKGPKGEEGKDWNNPSRVYDLSKYDPARHNLGLFTGAQIAEGRWLADYDLDTWIPATPYLAKALLPPTNLGFGRPPEKPLSHAIITTDEPFPGVETYYDLKEGVEGDINGEMLVEFRGGDYSHETMIAPSLHTPPDIRIQLLGGQDIGHYPLLVAKRHCLDYAIATLLCRWVPGGLHHDHRLALAGFLLKNGFERERTVTLLLAIATAQLKTGVPNFSQKDLGDPQLVVQTTWERIQSKEKKIAGGPKFAEHCGARGKDIVARLRKWIGGSASLDRLILNPAEPMRSARVFVERRYTLNDTQTLYNQNKVFYRFASPAYREHDEAAMRAEMWAFLDSASTRTGGEDPSLVPFQPNTTKVNNALDALRGVANLHVERAAPIWLANDPGVEPVDILACSNGLLYVPERRLLAPTPDFFNLNAIECAYDPNAPLPTRWLAFLAELWKDDPESISTLQEIFGYLLCTDTRFQKIFMLIGPKRSGKSLIARILTKLVGERNTAKPTLASFGDQFGKQSLINKTLAIIADARLGGRTDAAAVAETLLSISGEDNPGVPRKFLDDWVGTLTVRFLLVTNELPKIGDVSGALASRFVILKLTESFYGKEDLGLYDKLAPELPGILNWALEGRDRLYDRKYFVQPKSAQDYLDAFGDLSSPQAEMLTECTEQTGSVEAADLFAAWETWARQNGIEHPGTASSFGRHVRAARPTVTLKKVGSAGEQRRKWFGIRLNEVWAEKVTSSPPSRGDEPPLPEM